MGSISLPLPSPCLRPVAPVDGPTMPRSLRPVALVDAQPRNLALPPTPANLWQRRRDLKVKGNRNGFGSLFKLRPSVSPLCTSLSFFRPLPPLLLTLPFFSGEEEGCKPEGAIAAAAAAPSSSEEALLLLKVEMDKHARLVGDMPDEVIEAFLARPPTDDDGDKKVRTR